MRTLRLRQATLGLVAAVAMVLGLATPAHAAYPTTSFNVCYLETFCYSASTRGTITWYNRTAKVTGDVVDNISRGSTTAYFYAYAGTTLIDHQTRTADDENPNLGSPRGFNFTIGDTNLVGGINEIDIWICTTFGCVSEIHEYPKPRP